MPPEDVGLPFPSWSPVPTTAQVTSSVGSTWKPTACEPFISQMATVPDVWRQRMSAFPSPSKSGVPMTSHSVSTLAIPAPPTICEPFSSQLAKSPESCRHSTSSRPSPLKSPSPTSFHAGSTANTFADATTWPPFISHIATVPALCRHRTSLRPSPLKSRSAALTVIAVRIAAATNDEHRNPQSAISTPSRWARIMTCRLLPSSGCTDGEEPGKTNLGKRAFGKRLREDPETRGLYHTAGLASATNEQRTNINQGNVPVRNHGWDLSKAIDGR